MKLTSIVQGACCACAFGIAFAAPCHAQGHTRQFYEIGVGLNTEEPQFAIRSETGPTVGFALGHPLNSQLSVNGSLMAAIFGSPKQFVSPGGCLGSGPCDPPMASTVEVGTLGFGAEYALSRMSTTPLVTAGGGVRYLSESPQRENDVRPFVELGAGVLLGRWTVRARYQAASPGSDLPKWMMPITIGYRF